MINYLVEFIGTFIFLSVILTSGEAIPIGVALAGVILFGGKISGGNFNPAVSLSMLLSNKLGTMDTMAYIAAQVAGAAAAVMFVKNASKH